MREIELLAPAANADIAIEAILHGADAVYIGGPAYGARKNATNSIEDIMKVVDFGHQYRVKVYVTVNTIVYDCEIPRVEKMIAKLYNIGVDAIIVQDMGILEMDLPPIALHASTQCDTRTIEKAKFLENSGFSQIVLARELSLGEIKDICDNITVPIECFVHGALCVSYSGKCHASCATTGRSANRGECAQLCRLPYSLHDCNGKTLIKDCHLLSLKDFNTLDYLDDLLIAGVSSFKIEGRLKDKDYVKNVTAAYRKKLDEIIRNHPDQYRRSSVGFSEITFNPNLNKSFNRGFTTYFLNQRRPTAITQPSTPKSMGEIIGDISELNNGDGISFFNSKGEYEGLLINGVNKGEIIGNRPFLIPKGAKIHRTFDKEWQKALAKNTANRKIPLIIRLDLTGVTAEDARGCKIKLPLPDLPQKSIKASNYKEVFSKLGNTHYIMKFFTDELAPRWFIPISKMTDLRRRMIEALDKVARATYKFDYRRKECSPNNYPAEELTYMDNVANRLAESFYKRHGVIEIERAMETRDNSYKKEITRKESYERIMTTRHCILRENGLCLKDPRNSNLKILQPFYLTGSNLQFRLNFDCIACEMHVENPL